MKELQKLNKYFLKYKYRFLVGIIITVASQIFTVFTPQFVGDAINILQDFLQNKISAETTRQGLWNNMMLIIGTTLIAGFLRSEEHTSELQSRPHLVCRLLLE